MRGIKNEWEHEEALRMLKDGISPSEVARQLYLPLSTVTTWNKEVRAENKKPLTDIEKKIRLKNYAKLINDSEAKIMTSFNMIANPNITDEQWFDVQNVVTEELKRITIETMTDFVPVKTKKTVPVNAMSLSFKTIESKIADIYEDFIVCSITQEEQDDIQIKLHELICMAGNIPVKKKKTPDTSGQLEFKF